MSKYLLNNLFQTLDDLTNQEEDFNNNDTFKEVIGDKPGPGTRELSGKNVGDDEEFLDEKLAANCYGRQNIGAKLKPEVYKSAVVEQGCLVMGGSDTGQAKKTSG